MQKLRTGSHRTAELSLRTAQLYLPNAARLNTSTAEPAAFTGHARRSCISLTQGTATYLVFHGVTEPGWMSELRRLHTCSERIETRVRQRKLAHKHARTHHWAALIHVACVSTRHTAITTQRALSPSCEPAHTQNAAPSAHSVLLSVARSDVPRNGNYIQSETP